MVELHIHVINYLTFLLHNRQVRVGVWDDWGGGVAKNGIVNMWVLSDLCFLAIKQIKFKMKIHHL